MNSHYGPTDLGTSSPKEHSRTIWASAAVSAACFAFYFAEQHGFRIFEESTGTIAAQEFNIPSPMEVLALLGVTSVGVCAALVAVISMGAWLVRQVRHLRSASQNETADRMSEGPAHHGTA